MGDVQKTTVLAVDGGGTRCRLAIDGAAGGFSVETGPANASTDLKGAVREILSGLGALSSRAGCEVADIAGHPAFVGLAGVVSDDISAALRFALPFRNVRIADDRPAAVRGVLKLRDGYLGHCGTGSFQAVQLDGVIRLSGGWGSQLGDEASAQWVGRRALSLTLRASDGRQAVSALSDRLLDRFGGAAGIVAFAAKATPQEFGALAPLVTDCAADGDANARAILKEGAGDIASSLRSLGWKRGQPICLTGGIGPHYATYLPEDMQPDVTRAEGEPLDGAISLARDFAREIEDERG